MEINIIQTMYYATIRFLLRLAHLIQLEVVPYPVGL